MSSGVNHPSKESSLPPKGAVGLVEEDERLAQDKARLEARLKVHEPVHHIFTEKEE